MLRALPPNFGVIRDADTLDVVPLLEHSTSSDFRCSCWRYTRFRLMWERPNTSVMWLQRSTGQLLE